MKWTMGEALMAVLWGNFALDIIQHFVGDELLTYLDDNSNGDEGQENETFDRGY